MNTPPVPYTKQYLTLPRQLALLKTRGLQFTDDQKAMDCLHRNGYYRLSGYWYPFREIDLTGNHTDTFLPGSQFDHALDLYLFDKALKLLLLDGLERIEIAVRSEIATVLGRRDRFAHENRRRFDGQFTSPFGVSKYDSWLSKYHQQVARSKDTFVKHYGDKYGKQGPLPIWIAIELWDFGLTSQAYSGMQFNDQLAVAARFSVPEPKLMESWLRCLNYVRNVIAHHGRLWNLNLNVTPSRPSLGQISEFDIWHSMPTVHTRVYGACCIVSYLSHTINPGAQWSANLKRHVRYFPAMPHANIQAMGFPTNWKTHDFWKY
jgi:abortive infection bacteriophage resistance protein